jgi:hypothetical protein
VTPADAFVWMLRICGVGIALDAVEQLSTLTALDRGGLCAWHVVRHRFDLAPAVVRRVLDAACDGTWRPGLVLASRLLWVTIAALWPPGSALFAIALTALLVTQLYLFIRRAGFGLYGSDQMTLIILASAWLGTVVDTSPLGVKLALWFAVAQSCLSYGVNGVAKLASRSWRSGRALPAVFSTHASGAPVLLQVVEARPGLSRALGWLVLAWECTFPLVLVVPDSIRIGLLISGVVFHATIAMTMGLHLFVWAFIAPYAAIWTITR